MTIHFSNILTYQHFGLRDHKRIIFVDGFLLQLALLIVTLRWHKKNSGLNYHSSLKSPTNFYLLAGPTLQASNGLILPFWNSLDDIKVNQELLEKIKPYQIIILGISSPKQDVLAEKLNEYFPEKLFYSLGAAVYVKSISRSETVLITLGSMLVANPRRTLVKLILSISAFFKAVTLDRSKIKNFSILLKANSERAYRSQDVI